MRHKRSNCSANPSTPLPLLMKTSPLLTATLLLATSLLLRADVIMSDGFGINAGNRAGDGVVVGRSLGGDITANATAVEVGTGLVWQNKYTLNATTSAMNGFVYGTGGCAVPDPAKTTANCYVPFVFAADGATDYPQILTASADFKAGDNKSSTSGVWCLGFWQAADNANLTNIVSGDYVKARFFPAGTNEGKVQLQINIDGVQSTSISPTVMTFGATDVIRLTVSYDMNTGEAVATAYDVTTATLMSTTKFTNASISDLKLVGFGMAGLLANRTIPSTVDNFNVSTGHKTSELITDRNFRAGFLTYEPCLGVPKTNTVDGMLQYTAKAGPPMWTLAQWCSHASIAGTTPTVLATGAYQWNTAATTLAPGAYEWRNAYKSIAFGPDSATDVVLSVDSNAEYGGVFRTGNNPTGDPDWPHLIIGQRVSNPQGKFGEAAPSIKELTALVMNVDLKLLQATNNHGTGYNENIHSSIFYIGIPVQNLNDTSPDFGKVISFGIMVYDDRANFESCLNGNLFYRSYQGIYQIGMPFTTTLLQINLWKTLHGDILPYILDAITYAKSTGYIAPTTPLSDFKIGNLGLSWEVSGLSKVSIQARNYSLKAVGPAFPPACEFNSAGNKEEWTSYNITDNNTGGGTWNLVTLNTTGNDPQLVSPAMKMDANEFKQVKIRMMNNHNDVPGTNWGTRATLFWKHDADTTFSGARSKQITISNDGTYAEYTFDMTGNADWSGEITQLRFDPVIQGSGQPIAIDYIHFN